MCPNVMPGLAGILVVESSNLLVFGDPVPDADGKAAAVAE